MDNHNDPGHLGFGQPKSIRTFIHSGKQTHFENDGIHLTYEMQNDFSLADQQTSIIR